LIDAKPEDNNFLSRATEAHKISSTPFLGVQHSALHVTWQGKKKKVSWLDTNKCTCGYPESKI
jgi:hypothetical protein